jgi:hypothetical protein
VGRRLADQRLRLEGRRGMGSSNLGHSSRIRRLGHVFLLRSGSTRTENREAHGRQPGGGGAPSLGYGALNLKVTTPT